MERCETAATLTSPEEDTALIFTNSSLVTILVGPSQIKHIVHEQVLVSRCPFFAKCLGSGMRESLANVVELPEESPAAVNQVLTYLYTNEIRHIEKRPLYTAQDAIDGMVAWVLADKFDMPNLQDKLIDALMAYWNKWAVFPQMVSWALDHAGDSSPLFKLVSGQFSHDFARGYSILLGNFVRSAEYLDGFRELVVKDTLLAATLLSNATQWRRAVSQPYPYHALATELGAQGM